MGTAFTLVSPSTSTLSSTAKSTSRLTHPHDIANTPQKARDPVKGLKPSAQPAMAFQTIRDILVCNRASHITLNFTVDGISWGKCVKATPLA